MAAYDVLVLDAFSSDSIPMHLLTREALALYLRKLAPGGHLLFHISSRTLDLRPGGRRARRRCRRAARMLVDSPPPAPAVAAHAGSVVALAGRGRRARRSRPGEGRTEMPPFDARARGPTNGRTFSGIRLGF